jgi:hypothetical protein
MRAQAAWPLALIGLVVALAGAQATTAGRPRAVGARYTPLVQSVFSTPRWFEGTDGRFHLVYELELTNGFPVPVTVASVQVRDARRGRVLATLHGRSLRAAMSLLASPATPATVVPASAIGVVWLDVTFSRRSLIPAGVEQRLTVRVPPGLPVPRTITDTGGAARVDRRAPVLIGPPLRGAGWAAVGSCCDGPHRRSIQPVDGTLYLGQRFAIDFNRLSPGNLIATGDRNRNESYPTYGEPVIAVANARVVEAVDRWPDQIPNHPRPVTLEEADGNHVILSLGGGRFAFYAHLRPGSVVARRGQRVRRGQLLGETGNSGSSTGPHLHFHVMNSPSALAADGLPYVFDRFFLTGRIPDLDRLVVLDRKRLPIPIDRRGAGERRRELPLGRDLVAFPG